MFYLYPRLRLLSAQLTWPVSRYRETGYLVQPKPDLCLLLTDKNSFTTYAGIWPSESDIEIELEEELILKKKFSTFQTVVERKGLGIILGEPSVSLRRVCLPHKLAGVDVIWPFCVIYGKVGLQGSSHLLTRFCCKISCRTQMEGGRM